MVKYDVMMMKFATNLSSTYDTLLDIKLFHILRIRKNRILHLKNVTIFII